MGVSPEQAFAETLGVRTDGPQGDPRSQVGMLFNLALMRAGKGGCACDTCGYCQQIVDLMVQLAPDPFPAQPPPAAPPAPPPPPPAEEVAHA